VDLRALLVGGVGQERVVGAVLGGADLEVRLAFCEGLDVEQRLFLAAVAGRRANTGCWAPVS
jgi:hypothetical protein